MNALEKQNKKYKKYKKDYRNVKYKIKSFVNCYWKFIDNVVIVNNVIGEPFSENEAENEYYNEHDIEYLEYLD